MQPLESALSQSIQHYACLLTFLQEMDQAMGTADPTALQHFSASLQAFQEQALQVDGDVAAQLNQKSLKTELIQGLVEKREALLKELLALNTNMTAKASGIKSLISHEIGKLHTGLSALNGYRQPQQTQGRITDCTS